MLLHLIWRSRGERADRAIVTISGASRRVRAYELRVRENGAQAAGRGKLRVQTGTRPGTSALRRRWLASSRLEFLQRLRAADGHLLLVGFEAFQNPPTARFDAFAKPLDIAHAIGPKIRQFLRSSGRRSEARGDQSS
jgi:hypothetical protein